VSCTDVLICDGTISGFTSSPIRIVECKGVRTRGLRLEDNGNCASFGGVVATDTLGLEITDITSHKNAGGAAQLLGVQNASLSGIRSSDSRPGGIQCSLYPTQGTGCSDIFACSSAETKLINLIIHDCVLLGGTGGSASRGIEIGAEPGVPRARGVVIKNCQVIGRTADGTAPSVTNDVVGISISATDEYRVEDCVCSRQYHPWSASATAPVGATGVAGISLCDSTKGVVKNNTCNDNVSSAGAASGIRVRGCSSTLIDNCTTLGNVNTAGGEAWGISTDVEDMAAHGVPPVSTGLIIKDCHAMASASTGATRGGFKLQSTVNSLVENNRAVDCGTGFLVSHAGNTCQAFNNTVRGNTAQGNAFAGFVDTTPLSAATTYCGNTSKHDGPGPEYSKSFVGLPEGTSVETWALGKPAPICSSLTNLAIIA
jgi:parallel beta-helix repeat protein